jgi:hypothetical protein
MVHEVRHRAALMRMRLPMRRILDAGAPMPEIIPDFVIQRAEELDVDLPGMGD